MTQDEIIDLAELAGYESLIKFAKLVAAKKAKECAELVEKMGIEGYGTLAIAAAIRSGNKP